MTLFNNKYRVESTRLPNWHYEWAGCYFVTICIKDRSHHFGNVIEAAMHLSPLGEIAAEEWLQTENLRANVELDEWIIMPNHLHLILHLTHQIPTTRTYNPDPKLQTANASKAWRANSLGSIIGQFKSKCTKRIRAAGQTDFIWLPRYYERIIQTEHSLKKARNYVAANPSNWYLDRNNINSLYM